MHNIEYRDYEESLERMRREMREEDEIRYPKLRAKGSCHGVDAVGHMRYEQIGGGDSNLLEAVVKPGNGCSGAVYKNPRAYYENSGICYIPESSFDGVPEIGCGWFAVRDIIAVNGREAVYVHADVVDGCGGDEFAAELVFALLGAEPKCKVP